MKKVKILFSTLFFSICLYGFPLSTHAIAHRGMVVSEHKLASQIGVDILRAGGNAIDAAVAVAYALAVVNPCCGNIGGSGFMTIHFADGKDSALIFRGRAPEKAYRNMFLPKQHLNNHLQGYLAVTVPGTVLGLETALKKYGTFSRQQVMMPAIQLAEKGYRVSEYDAKQFRLFENEFKQQPNVAAIFLHNQHTYPAGSLLIQQDLANTLKLIAHQGSEVFYKGVIAERIVNSSRKNGGILTLADFKHYQVEERSPVYCNYRGYTIISSPLPSSGGTILCEMLNILEHFPLNKLQFNSSQSVHYIVETMRYGFIDRNNKLGDPIFVKNPDVELISKKYAADIAKQIQHTYFLNPFLSFQPDKEMTDTTHYSVIDSKGNAVSVTYSLNGLFGAQVIADHTGFFLNNEMDDFTTKLGATNKFGLIQSMKNDIAPHKRPLSSMTPTIIMKDGHVWMVVGSPGGPRIITSVLLTILNVIDYHLTLQQAINAPRYHYQNSVDMIEVEPLALSLMTTEKLKYLGYRIDPQGYFGAVEAILIKPNGCIVGANDDRRPNGAAIEE